MPKRSADKKIEKYKNKIRKLERRRIRVLSDSSSSDSEGKQFLKYLSVIKFNFGLHWG